MCSETSPRISFSHDLGYTDDTPTEDNIPRRDTSILESNSDFEFNISSSLEQESSSADELFANGMILPVQERMVAQKHVRRCVPPRLVSLPPLPYPSKIESSKKESVKEIMVVNSDLEEKQQSKSFWKFKRSSSLNCDIKKSLVCSLPLLSRSNSTGSVSNSKKSMLKDSHKHNSQKQSLMSMARSSSSSSSSSSLQKPPLKKSHGGAYGNGVKIIPVLNVPPPYISRGTANLFGLGSFLRNGKDKKSKK